MVAGMATAAGLEVRESGRALSFHTETPHLVSTGSGRLSTTVTLHPLPEGRIIVGSSPKADIQLDGSGVEFVHCIIENASGSVTLHPLSGNTCVDGAQIAEPVRLSQGCMLTIGRSNYLRFNHPAEAKHLKSVLPSNTRPAITPTTFTNGYHESTQQQQHYHNYNQSDHRKPPVVPRKSPRNSNCSDEEVNFLGKLNKFEMLSRQTRTNCVSPKVFPPGSLTTNVPADQILGHSRSSSLASLGRSSTSSPFQNLTNFDRYQNNDEPKMCSLPVTINRNHSPSQNSIYANIGSQSTRNSNNDNDSQYSRSWQQQLLSNQHHDQGRTDSQELILDNENRNNNVLSNGNGYSSSDHQLMSQSLICESSSDFDHFNRDFDMSQSLIVRKKTTTTEFLQLEKFGSNPSLPCHRRTSSYDSRNSQDFCSQPNIRRIQPPSPAYNRDPKYTDSKSLYGRINHPMGQQQQQYQAMSNHNSSSSSLQGELHQRQIQDSRQRDRELEKVGLEEILAMCAEYERKSSGTADYQQQNRTTPTMNGTLAHQEKRPYHSSPRAKSPEAPAAHHHQQQQQFHYQQIGSSHQTLPPTYENVTPSAVDQQQVVPPNNNRPDQNGYSTPPPCNQHRQQDSRNSSYEEIESLAEEERADREKPRLEETGVANGTHPHDETTGSNSSPTSTTTTTSPPLPEKNVKLSVHHYENFVPLNGNLLSVYENVNNNNNNNNNNNIINNNNNNNNNGIGSEARTKRSKPARRQQVVEDKLDVSNDDLLEAIEQLSMLSKPRRSFGTETEVAAVAQTTTTTTTTPQVMPKKVQASEKKRELEDEDRRRYVEFLQNEKLHILSNMDIYKRSVAEIENQEEEINRELELEKALLSAEHESEGLKLEQDELERARVEGAVAELDREMSVSGGAQSKMQAEAKQRVHAAQQACARLEEELADAKGRDDERDSELADRLAAQADTLETEKKAFEDLEFHHLEEEASRLASREELQRYHGELLTRIEGRKKQLDQLQAQRTDIKNSVTKEAKSLERRKLAYLRRLEEGRNRLRAIEDELESLAKNTPADNLDDKRSPSREDYDRISRVTNDSPIVNNQGILGRKTIEEIERNRQLHLAKQGREVILEERRRVEELMRRVQDEVRSQWEERKMNCASFNSVESGEESSSYSTGPTESGSGSSDGADNGTGEKSPPGKLCPEFASPSPGPSGDSYTLLQSDSTRDDRPTSMENGSGSGIADETESRPLSQTSSELDSISPLPVKHRNAKPRLQRPLTRYLPIRSESLNLRHHIETAGHHLQLIHDVTVDTTTCSGYLSKMSKKFHHWNKRWFVFDRKRKTLTYYGDSNSRKPRGVIYFQSIEDVYVDHLNTVKSPQPSLTFIVKTTTRLYHLMAPSPEAMRVWVDVVFTGAEGYHEFDPNA
ncbi:putative uncharacterized protein DDB_G0287457 isoform X2 [Copidosoma floridanum]|uniref:putative uncharacterized protein DDB_G0287457 isoform X2 n=1 Tax=Copidosoma floridanum TaxID=29053 RepID=UPI0006C970E0|nr:putative uncharacterized protein DDB_G0287457 isoform X2 [Copidosoma floridanum]